MTALVAHGGSGTGPHLEYLLFGGALILLGGIFLRDRSTPRYVSLGLVLLGAVLAAASVIVG